MTKILLSALILCVFATLTTAQDSKPSSRPSTAPSSKPTLKPGANNPVIIMSTSMGDITIELFAKEAPKTVANFIGLAEGTREWTDPKTNKKVTRPFYDNLIFHRVIDNFMLQGGCPLGSGSGSPGFSFEDEINPKAFGFEKVKAINGESLGQGVQRNHFQMAARAAAKDMGIDPTDSAVMQKRWPEVLEVLKTWNKLQVLEAAGYKYNDKLPVSRSPVRGCLAMANSGPNTNGSQFFINVVDTPHLAGLHTVFGQVIKGMDIVDMIKKVAVNGGSKPVKDVVIKSVRLVKTKKK